MSSRNMLIATSVALGLGLTTVAAQAAPVLGSHVDSSTFSTSIGAVAGWSYLGQATTAFVGAGTAQIVSRSANYDDSFGFATAGHGSLAQVFSASAAVGSSATVAGYSPSYLLYFSANGADSFFSSDDNKQYTDGFDSGNSPGEEQGDIDIFFNSSLSKWALFFDDAGGGNGISGDDNDYNDMVVTFVQTHAVPEPGTMALLGAGLLGLGALRRRKAARTA